MTRCHFGSTLFILFFALCSALVQPILASGPISSDPPATCDIPEFLGALAITEQSAALTWAVPPSLSGATFEVEILETGMPFSGIPNHVAIVAPPYSVGALLPGKTYKYRVRSQCSGGMVSAWSVEKRFRTVLLNPQCGLQLQLADTSCAPETNQFRIKVAQVPGTQLGTDVSLRSVLITMSHTWASDMKLHLVSPSGVRITLLDSIATGGNHFGDIASAHCNNPMILSEACALRSIKGAQAPFIGTFSPLQSFGLLNDGSDPNGIWTLEACDMFPSDRGTLHFLELVFEPLVCPAPVAASVLNVSISGAQVMTPSGMGCDSLIVEYGPRGFRPGNGASAGPSGSLIRIPCSATMAQLSGLAPFTEYSAYLRKVCGAGVYSPNSCRTDFFTDCFLPSEEQTFNSQNNCNTLCSAPCLVSGHWENITTDQTDWITTDRPTPTAQTGPNADFEGGGKFAYFEASGNDCPLARTAVLLSHCLNVTDQPGDCDMGFAYHMFGAHIGTLKLDVSTNGGSTWATIWQRSGNVGNQWNRQKIDLASFHNQTILLRFVAINGNGPAGDIAIDNVRFFGATFENHGAFTYYRDADGDGFGNPQFPIKTCASTIPAGFVANSSDCDDNNSQIRPGATEVYCNGIDENCNGMADDRLLPAPTVSDVAVCADLPVTLSASQPRGTVYWYAAGTNTFMGAGNQLPLAQTVMVPLGSQSSSLTIVAKDSLPGCPGAFDTISVLVWARPQLIQTDSVALCVGQSIQLNQLPISDQRQTGGQLRFYSGFPFTAQQEVTSTSISPPASTTLFGQMQTAQGCSDTVALFVKVNQLPDVQIQQGDTLSLCRGAEGVLSASATGAASPFAYSWSNGLNFQQIPVFGGAGGSGTSYQVTATDANGCSSSDRVFVRTYSSVTQTDIVQIQSVSQCGLSDGSITLRPLNGTGPYRFDWSGSSSGSLSNISTQGTIGGLATGSYRITVTDSSPNGGCGMVMPLIVVSAPNFKVDSVLTTHPTCYGDRTGRIELKITGSNPMVTWQNSSTGAVLTQLGAGIYSATITDGACQKVVSQIQLRQPDSISIKPNTIRNVQCHGDHSGAIDVFVSGGNGLYNYAWSNGAASPNIDQLSVGVYTVTVTDAKGCTERVGIQITEPPPLSIAVDSLKSPNCNADSSGYLRLKFAGGILPYTYQWENLSTSLERVHLPAGIYRLTLTDGNQCVQTFNQQLFEPLPLQATAGNVRQPTCVGVQDGAISIQVNGGTQPYSALWSHPNATGLSLMQLGGGTYHVTVTDSKGCKAQIQNIELTANQLIPISNIAAQPVRCFGGTDGAVNFTLPNPSQYLIRLNNQTYGAAPIAGLSSGMYILDVKNQQGCQLKDTVRITQPTEPLQTQVQNVEQPLCAGKSSGAISVITHGGTAPYQFMWSNGQSTQSIQMLDAGAFTLTVTDRNLCTATIPTVQIVEPPALLTTATKSDIPCFGSSTGSIELSVSGGVPPYRYLWNTQSTASAIYGLAQGLYSVTVTDQNGCLQELKTIEILDLKQAFEVAVVKTQNATCRNQANGQIVVQVNNSTGPYSFNWGQPIGLRTRTAASDSLMQLAPGTYQVTVTNGSGCVAVSQPISILNPPLLQVTQSLTDVNCLGAQTGQIMLTLSGGVAPYKFVWSDSGPDTSHRVSLPAGVYHVTVSDFNQCTMQLGPFEIKEPSSGIRVEVDTLHGGISDDNCSNCKGRIFLNVTGGQGNYTYRWNDGVSTQDRPDLCAGLYTLTVSDFSTCTRVYGPVEIKALSNPPGFSSIRIQDIACHGTPGGSINTTLAGGTPPYIVYWSNNLRGDTITRLSAGLYVATITDAAACSSTFGVVVSELSESPLEVEHVFQSPNWASSNGSLSLSVKGGKPGYNVSWSPNVNGQTGFHLTGLPAGIYTATVSDQVGCTTVHATDITSSTDQFPQDELGLTILPNPATSWLTIQILSPTANFSDVHYSIHSVTGAQISTPALLPREGRIPIDHLQAGVYLLRCMNSQGEVLYGRFIKDGT